MKLKQKVNKYGTYMTANYTKDKFGFFRICIDFMNINIDIEYISRHCFY